MKEELFRRRLRLVRLLAMGNGLSVIVDTLCKEFNCKDKAVYKDYANMHVWAHTIEQDKQLGTILRARMDLLSREALDLMMTGKNEELTFKEKLVKIGAMNTVLKITVEQIKLAQELGYIERKPEVINANISVGMPYLASPEIAAAYSTLHEAQKAEKEAQDKAREEKNASSETSVKTGC